MGDNGLGEWLNNWLGNSGWCVALFVMVAACLATVYANPSNKVKVWLQLVVYYAKYWAVWLWCWSLWHWWYQPDSFYGLTALLALWYVYASWIEPNRLQIRYQHIVLGKPRASTHATKNAVPNPQPLSSSLPQTTTPPLKLAVVGDIHVGIFFSQQQLNYLVHRLNQLDVDAVVVTGDWLYHAGSDIMGKLLALKALNKPCYTVLSEADTAQLQSVNQAYQRSDGGNYLLMNERLTQILHTMGVVVLGQADLTSAQPSAIQINAVNIRGFNDGLASTSVVTTAKQPASQKTVILTHDIKQFLANSQNLHYLNEHTLVIAGQTHGGQVNIPWLTPWLVKALTGNTSPDGLSYHQLDKTGITQRLAKKPIGFYGWTTTGVGMTGLPFRFRCPPRVDVLIIR